MSVEQPPIRPGGVRSKGRYSMGGAKAQYKLKQLNFDPLEFLVDTARKLKAQVERHEAIQKGEIVPLNASGKPVNYNAEHHLSALEKMANVGDKLIRYAYGRVPEGVQPGEGGKPKLGLTVNLTRKGEVFKVNMGGDDDEQPEFFDSEFDAEDAVVIENGS